MPRYSPKIVFLLSILLSTLSGCGGKYETGVQIEVIPPQSVEYLGLTTFQLGQEIAPIVPQVVGGEPNDWTINPPLPTGMNLDPLYGVISGTPEQVQPATEHVVIAKNGSGTAYATIEISVVSTVPCSLNYGSNIPFLIIETAMEPITPSYACSLIEQWDVEPELPEGLQLSEVDGTISGTPLILTASSVHVVSGSNQFGSTSTEIELKIIEPAPCGLEYSTSLVQLSHGEELTSFSPNFACGTPTLFEIEPDLPVGLLFDSDTGELSGSVFEAFPLTDYQIMASNPAGSTAFQLQLEVLEEGPCDLIYPLSEIMIQVGDEIPAVMSPEVSCGPVAHYSVDPELPQGLLLDASSGLISGIPQEPLLLSSFTLKAENSGGSAEFILQIQVFPNAPCDLQYDPAALILEQGIPLALFIPQVGCGQASLFEITPELPQGLIFNNLTGGISGTPEFLQEAVTYTVAAANVSGADTTQLSIEVRPSPPCNFSYPDSSLQLTVGHALSAITPEIGCGGAGTFNSLPPLPSGLFLDSSNGTISGIPLLSGGPTMHVILAGNASGTDSFTLTIEIAEEAPCDLTYSVLEIDAIVGQEIGPLEPLLGCGQATIWSVSPELPLGLNLDAITGIISGNVDTVYPQGTYQIVAENSSGSSVIELPIQIREPAPCNLNYGIDVISLLPGESLLPLVPTIECGTAINFSVDPALPDGFELDSLNGQISGASMEEQPLQSYLITASNDTGAITTSLQLEVKGQAPCDITYPTLPIAVPSGVDLVSQVPQQGCGNVDLWSIDPALPLGLEFNPDTGSISGLADQESDTIHLVTAENQYGTTQTEIRVVVRSVFHYRGSELEILYSDSDGVGSGALILYAEESQLNLTYPTPLSGLSMAILYDAGILQYVEHQQSGSIAELNNGSGPDFWAVNPIDGGVLVGMLASFSFNDSLSLAEETPIVEFEFATVPDTFVGDSVGLSGELEWGNPTAIPLDNLVVIDGESSSIPIMESLPFSAQPQ